MQKPSKMIVKQHNGPSKINRKQVPSDVYLFPGKITEMAYKEEAKFIKLMKDYNIKDLSRFKGYEADPPVSLTTGRRVQTYTWNPLTFALVLGK